MDVSEVKNKVSTLLSDLAKRKGYLTFNDILGSAESASLPIDEVERLCEQVISEGFIIRDEDERVTDKPTLNDEDRYDKSHLDYNSIFKRILAIDSSLQGYIDQLKLIEPPQLREEVTLIHHAKEGNLYARERLITMFLKVALRLALWHHDRYGLPLDETIQDANIGLLLALEKMPMDNDHRYTTYAPWWVRQYVSRYTQGVSKTFYTIPVHIKDKLLIVIKTKKTHDCPSCIKQEYCTNLVEEICSILSVDTETAKYYLSRIENPLSIEVLIDLEDEKFLNDEGKGIEGMEEALHLEGLREQLADVLSVLKERERTVLELRYGLHDGIQKTLEEVGSIIGVTRERIRQIEAKAFVKIRSPKYAKKLSLFEL